jgi:putative peptidoglycan lipid II flippase
MAPTDTTTDPAVLRQQPHSAHQPVARPNSLTANFRIVSLCTLASRVLGMARDTAMANLFGAGMILDAFTVAFRIPNLARQLFGEGALTSAFLPLLVRDLQSTDRNAARELATAVFIALAGVLLVVVGTAELTIAAALHWGPLPAHGKLLLELLAILIPYVIFVCLAAQVCAVLHSLRQFTWPALLPVVLNLVWLACTGAVAMRGDAPSAQVRWIAACLVGAGIVQLAVALAALRHAGFHFSPAWRRAWPRVREVFLATAPIVVAFTIAQFNTLLDSLLAWALAPAETGTGQSAVAAERVLPVLVESGTATALYLGQRMYQFPLGVFGVALGTVLFPLLSNHAQRGDFEALRRSLSYGVRLTISIGIPAAAGLVILSGPITALLFQHGRFDADDARLTSQMVAVYGAVVWAYIGLLIVHRGYYAVGDRITPMRIGLITATINIVLNLGLVWAVGGVGLALGTALSAVMQVVLATWKLQSRTGRLEWCAIGATAVRTLLAAALMMVTCLAVRDFAPRGMSLAERGVALGAPFIAGLIVYFVAAWLVRLSEPWELIGVKRSSVEY